MPDTEIACSECEARCQAIYDDERRGEAGPFTLLCDAGHEFYVPAETTARTRIAALRAIVKTHGATRIDGYIVDVVTASLLVTLYDALSPASREKFGKPGLAKLVDFAWSVAK